MIKKLLSSFLLITSLGVINSSAQALCTSDISCVPAGADTHGICPDSATGIPVATINQAYTVTMSNKIPAHTIVDQFGFPVTATLTHFVVIDVQVKIAGNWVPLTDLGSDLSYEGNGANTPSGGVAGPTGFTSTHYCYWDAPNSGCLIFTGTPTISGDFPIKITCKARGVVAPAPAQWGDAPDITAYHLVVNGPAGVSSLDLNKFEVDQNAPNPFSEKSEIHFSSVSISDVEFKVYNMLGSVVYNSNIKSVKGLNTITMEANSFTPGVYMYSIKNGDTTITKRMVVSK